MIHRVLEATVAYATLICTFYYYYYYYTLPPATSFTTSATRTDYSITIKTIN